MSAPAPAGRRTSVAVVIPMYDEEAGAEACVAEVCRELAALPVPSRLIVVDDGSRDRTAAVLERAAADRPLVRVVRHEANRGYGAALRTGVEAAAEEGFEYVLFMDSDLTNSPADIPRFVEKMAEGLDVIKATRYRLGGGFRGVPPARVRWSRLGNALARRLFRIGISDCTNGFRAVRTEILQRLRLRERRFPVIVEELWCCVFLARSFAEVPVMLTDRHSGLRPTSFVYRPAVFWHYLKYALLAALRIPPTGRLATRQEGGR